MGHTTRFQSYRPWREPIYHDHRDGTVGMMWQPSPLLPEHAAMRRIARAACRRHAATAHVPLRQRLAHFQIGFTAFMRLEVCGEVVMEWSWFVHV